MTHLQKVANFYLELLSIPINNPFRVHNQSLYAVCVVTLAKELNETNETVQRVFERMASK